MALHDQRLKLSEQRRQDRHRHADSQQDGHDRHRGRGHRARKSDPLQARNDRIEEIGDHHSDNEWQQDVVQKPEGEQEDGSSAQPEAPATAVGRPASVPRLAWCRHLA